MMVDDPVLDDAPPAVPEDEAITTPDLSKVFRDDEVDPLDPNALSDGEPEDTRDDEPEDLSVSLLSAPGAHGRAGG